MQFRGCIRLAGNVIDVAALHDKSTIIYSLDNYHNPSSTTTIASAQEQVSRPMIGCMSFNDSGQWERAKFMENALARMEKSAKDQEPIDSGVENGTPLRDLLYGIGNIRKRGQEDHD